MKKKQYSIIAAIDVGTNNLQMTIVQVNDDGEIVVLEELKKPTTIGSDTFTMGQITISTMHEIVNTLKGFRMKLKEYKVQSYKAVSTSAFREAQNRDYVLEHIRNHTGINIEIINNSQERYYMYQAMDHRSIVDYKKQSTLILNIASGGIEISIHDKGKLILMEYMNIGALRVSEMLSGFKNKAINISRIMEDYIYGRISRIEPIIKKTQIQCFVGLGSEINTLFGLCNSKKKWKVESTEISQLYQEMKELKDDKLIEKYSLSSKQMETLLPSVILLNLLLGMAKTKYIFVPMVELRQGIITDMADNVYLGSQKDQYEEIINLVWYINKKYGLERKHSEYVLELCVSIFDQTKKLHRLDKRERLYLQIAAILHGVGYYVNVDDQSATTYELIKKQRIMGLSNRELEIIANVAFYYGNEVPKQHHDNYQKLSFEDKIVVVKLAAILKIADGFDISHTSKINLLSLHIQKDNLYFTIKANEQIYLEEWTFEQNASFFEQVMGVQPRIKLKL